MVLTCAWVGLSHEGAGPWVQASEGPLSSGTTEMKETAPCPRTPQGWAGRGKERRVRVEVCLGCGGVTGKGKAS